MANWDGSEVRRLTDSPRQDDMPSWSPGGERILFRSFRDGNSEIYVMEKDGSSPVNLSANPAGDAAALWSPDGARILFMSDRNGTLDLYIMNSDRTELVNLSQDQGEVRFAAWSPDGSSIAFVSREPDGGGKIYITTPDGSHVYSLTGPQENEGWPVWFPLDP